jgi:hypothetical protein
MTAGTVVENQAAIAVAAPAFLTTVSTELVCCHDVQRAVNRAQIELY